jgi:CheY-like chemotaxis protein
VQSHAGTISLDTPSTGGARFIIRLPAGSRRERALEPGAPSSRPSPRRGGRILVVEDEDPVADLIVETLQDAGHRVGRSRRRSEALERLRDETFDVVIVDLRMPGMGEAEFRAALQSLDPGLVGRLVLVTGDTLSPEPEALGRKLRVPVLHKPFDLGALLEAVHSRLDQLGRS